MAREKTKADETPLLHPLIEDQTERRSAFKVRRSDFISKDVAIEDEAEALSDGWEVEKRKKKTIRIKRRKAAVDHLQDRIWCLLYNMGYPVLSGIDFKIVIEKQGGGTTRKKVGVFAKDEETAIVVECRARAERGKRSFASDIEESLETRKAVANSIRKQFGKAFKPKIIWFYVTENIIWSEKDIESAEAANIRIITENELQYFEAYIAHVGSAGRYQFLAEYLAGQEIPGLSGAKVPATRGQLGWDKFYSFTISARHLLKIAFVNHQALNHPDSRPAYQRMISKSRLKQIGEFIKRGGIFPTNILVNFTSECNFDLQPGETSGENTRLGLLHLPNEYKSAWIIDGQHRLFGFTNLPDEFLDRPLFVIAFEKLEASKEADLFITINHEQKSVPKSLLVALQADLKLGSADAKEAQVALGSALVRSLAADNTSPFFRRFAVPGVPATDSQNLTLAEAVKGLSQSTLLGKAAGKKARVAGYLSGLTDDETLVRARKVINGYFRGLMDANPKRWEAGRSAHICVNPGIRGHLRLLNEILRYQQSRNAIDPFTAQPDQLVAVVTKFAEPLFDWIRTANDDVVAEKFSRRFGEGGVTEYYYALCELLAVKNQGFGGEDYSDYQSKKSDLRSAVADANVNDLQSAISTVVIDALKKIYGVDELPSGDKAYWERGIENAEIKQNAYKKQQQTALEKRAPREAYLDLIDFDKIIRQKGNWEHLEPLLSIPMPGVNPKGKIYHLDWLAELNEIRRVSAHKSVYRQYTEDNYKFIEWLKKEIYGRLETAGIDLP